MPRIGSACRSPGAAGRRAAAPPRPQTTIVLASTTSVENTGPARAHPARLHHRRPASRCMWSRKAPARRSTPRGAAMPISCWCTIPRPSEIHGDGHGVSRAADRLERFHHRRPGRRSRACRRRRTMPWPRLRAIAAAKARVRLARRPQRHRCARNAAVEGGRASIRQRRRGRLVPRYRRRHGRRAQRRGGDGRLYAVRPRHLAQLREQGGSAIVVEGDPRLINRYDVIELNPAKHPRRSRPPRTASRNGWLSAEGQAAIGNFGGEGEQLFHPSAAAPR